LLALVKRAASILNRNIHLAGDYGLLIQLLLLWIGKDKNSINGNDVSGKENNFFG